MASHNHAVTFQSTNEPQKASSAVLQSTSTPPSDIIDETLVSENHHHGIGLPMKIFCPGTSMVADEEEARKNIKKLAIVSGLCLLFMVAEIVGGIMAKSLAIISDAAHLFSDIAGFLISLIAIFMTRKKATRKLSYGFHRAEVIGAVVSVSLVWAVTAYLIVEAVDRLKNPETVDGKIMMIVASFGLLVNILMAFMLHRGAHADHAHDAKEKATTETALEVSEEAAIGATSTSVALDQSGASKPTSKESVQKKPIKKQQENLNIKAAFIHVLGDMIQSVGVLIAAIVIYIEPDYKIADPICTFIFSVLVLASTFKLLKEAIHVLMEGTPSHVDPTAVKEDLLMVKGVVRVHDLHIWCLSSSKTTITVHVVIHLEPRTNVKSTLSERSMTLFSLEDYCQILSECQSIICEKYGIHHSTIQIECDEDLSSHCNPSMCVEKT